MAASRKSEILEHCAAGGLLREIFGRYAKRSNLDRDGTITDLAELHNAGQIDLLGLLSAFDMDAFSRSDYFDGHRFCSILIPRLDASAVQVMAAVQALSTRDGQDKAAYLPGDAVGAWCVAGTTRVDEVLALIERGNTFVGQFLPTTLVAGIELNEGKYLKKAIAFVEADHAENRLSAIRAIGLATLKKEASVSRAISTLESVLDRAADDRLRAHVLTAAFNIMSRLPDGPSGWLPGFTSKIAADPGPETLLACAHALLTHAKSISVDAVELLLQALRKLDPEQGEVTNVLDLALAELLGPAHVEQIIEFLEHVLPLNEGNLKIEQFESLCDALLTSKRPEFQTMAVRFFLTSEPSLWNAINSLVQTSVDGRFLLDVNFSTICPTGEQAMYLARKAVGYFLLRPVTTASFLVSLLRHVAEPIAEELRSLLWDPLLLNYGGATRTYLEEVVAATTDPTARHVTWALAQQDRYLQDLRSVGAIPELQPTERQRRSNHELENDRFSKAMKAAEKTSFLRQLMPTSVLLHGVRSISHVRGLDGATRRLDTKLGHIGTTLEHPRMLIVDPFGLEYITCAFRAELPPQ